MAGDWLKMEIATPDKPEVLAITASLAWDDPDLTVGKLFRVWRWFDQHTAEGNAKNVTSVLLNRIIGVSGFCEAMAKVGWLNINEAGISLPNFDRHNGNTAKNRAETARRVAKHRASEPASGDLATAPAERQEEAGFCNGKSVTKSVAREEKRRVSTSLRSVDDAVTLLTGLGVDPAHARDWMRVRKDKGAKGLTPTALATVQAEAAKAGVSLAKAVHVSAENDWRGFRADWYANLQQRRGSSATGQPGRYSAAAAAIYDEPGGRQRPGMIDA